MNDKQPHGHHDHAAHVKRLNRIVGQLQGVGRMLDEGRYCPDILAQTQAAASAIRSLEAEILAEHMRHCVIGALRAKNADDGEQKIEELVLMFKKRL